MPLQARTAKWRSVCDARRTSTKRTGGYRDCTYEVLCLHIPVHAQARARERVYVVIYTYTTTLVTPTW
jgi:hypothetical protein